jgi:methionyl-tRNA formyltransferase
MPTRLAVFSLVDWCFSTIRDWAASADNEIALLVTQSVKGNGAALQFSTLVGRETVVMVVPNVRTCEAILSELDVDLAVVFTFARVPESVATIPRHGCVNLHPSLLPAYRGANGYRSLYEGEPRIGATLHYLTAEFDAGPILAQSSVATPQDVEPVSALEALQRVATDTLVAGVPRALAGELGEKQDSSAATDAPKFSEEETVLSFAVSTRLFQCRFSALCLAGIQPVIMLENEHQPVRAVKRIDGLSAASPGVVTSTSRRAIVAAPDGILELELGKLPFESTGALSAR